MLEIGIPVYNAKDTLAKALDSLVAQTKNNFIVCLSIDGDGNSQFYKEIAQEYIRRGLKIRIIDSKENGGPGIARQRILDTTQCDYIMFLDSDDMLMPRAVEILYTQAKISNYDIIRSAFICENNTQNDRLMPQDIATITWFHGKIYKVAYLKEKNIHFHPRLRIDEDAYFNLIAWNSTPNRGETAEVTYIWRFNKNSITRKTESREYFENSYLYYITSQVDGLKELYRINQTYSASLVTQTLLNIYYYCMEAKFYELDETEMNQIIHSLTREPWINDYLMDGQNWIEIINSIKAGAVYDQTAIVFYDETFNIWAKRLLTE